MLKSRVEAHLRIILAVAFLPLLISCLDQDQTIIKEEHKVIGNPVPIDRKFAAINRRHKVLMAIFDSGIDYNHPDLINNVHFELDASGKPISAGYDYMANDQWASWHVVNTNQYELQDLSAEEQEDQLKTTTKDAFNNDLRRRIGERLCLVNEILHIDPRLKVYTHPYRATAVEEDTLYRHGTHVAGLMTYDRPDFGLIPYRLLPYHQSRQDKIDSAVGKGDRFATNFADAVADANRKGVRIINLSLGGSFTRPNSNETVQDEANFEKFNNYLKMISGSLTKTIKSYPHILFVAAAGNDSRWTDNASRIQYPCGVEADNVLCVGATTADDRKTDFTNVPINDVDLVFAPGTKIKSLSPSDRCPFLDHLIDDFLTEKSGVPLCTYNANQKIWSVDQAAEATKTILVKAAFDACSYKGKRYTKMSGTSMATPIVSHLAAEILAQYNYPLASQVIEEIKRSAVKKQGRNFLSYTLMNNFIKRRSWDDDKAPVPAVNVMMSEAATKKGSVSTTYRDVYNFLGIDVRANPNDPTLSLPVGITMGHER